MSDAFFFILIYCGLAVIFGLDDDLARWIGEMVREAVNAYNA